MGHRRSEPASSACWAEHGGDQRGQPAGHQQDGGVDRPGLARLAGAESSMTVELTFPSIARSLCRAPRRFAGGRAGLAALLSGTNVLYPGLAYHGAGCAQSNHGNRFT